MMPLVPGAPGFVFVPAEFDPTSISGLRWWIDAQDSATISATGSTLNSINDKSGNGFHATGVSAVLGSAINSRQTILLEAGARLAISPNLTFGSGKGMTLIHAIRLKAWTGANPGLIRESGGNHLVIFQGSTGRPFLRWGSSTDILRPGSGAAASLATNYIMTWRVTPAGVAEWRINGVTEHTASHAVTSGGATFNDWQWNATGQQAERHDGEILWYDSGLDSSTLAAAENWMAARWGISF